MTKAKKSFNIYVFGNPLVEKDSLPLVLLDYLRGCFQDVTFIELDPTENLPEEDKFVLLDTVINFEKVAVIKDLTDLVASPRYSLHDFDLGFQLMLMKKLGKIKDVLIIGVPPKKKEDVLEDVKRIITSLLLESGLRN